MGIFSSLWNKVRSANLAGKGSAFARVATHDAAITEAKGKIIALDAANKAHASAIYALEVSASKVHGVQSSIKSRLSALSSAL